MMEELQGKRLLLLGGNNWKEAIRELADTYGITLIATGNNRTAEIIEIADEYYYCNSVDAEMMKRLIVDKQIDGVYIGANETIITAASKYLNELGLPCYCTNEQWELFSNKARFRDLCKKARLPVVRKYEIDTDNLAECISGIDFPVITKPADSCGSNGFSVCFNGNELIEGYRKAAEASPTGSVIVEEYVNNSGVVVFYTFSNGEAHFSGLEDKYPVKFEKQGSYVAGACIFESPYTTEFRNGYEDKIKKLFANAGVREGTIWIEVFHDGNNFYFNEAGFRYGGTVSVYPIDYLYGINQIATDIYYALTGKSKLMTSPQLVRGQTRKKKYCIYCVYLEEGKISKISGARELLKKENIVAIPSSKKVGDIITSSGSFAQIFAPIHFVFDTGEEYRDTIETIHRELKVLNETGKNMVARMLDTDKQKILI